MGAGWERLADMMRAVGSTYTWRSKRVLRTDGLGLCRKIEKGYFGNFTKYRLGDLLPTRGARWRKVERIRSIEDEDGALRSVRKCPVCVGP